MITLASLVEQVTEALVGGPAAARRHYAAHLEELSATPSKLPATRSHLQQAPLEPLLPDHYEWTGDLYLDIKAGQVMAQFAPEDKKRRRRGVGRLTVRYDRGATPEGVHRITDEDADATTATLQAELLTASSQAEPDPPPPPTYTLDQITAALKHLEDNDGN